MSYLVKVPDAMVEAKNLIESESLLEAHKRLVHVHYSSWYHFLISLIIVLSFSESRN